MMTSSLVEEERKICKCRACLLHSEVKSCIDKQTGKCFVCLNYHTDEDEGI